MWIVIWRANRKVEGNGRAGQHSGSRIRTWITEIPGEGAHPHYLQVGGSRQFMAVVPPRYLDPARPLAQLAGATCAMQAKAKAKAKALGVQLPRLLRKRLMRQLGRFSHLIRSRRLLQLHLPTPHPQSQR